MSKTEFLDILYNQLSGQMPEGNVAAHVQYYRNYIEDEQQKGRTETEVLSELGDPRLIARTLLDTEVGAGNPQNGSTYSAAYNEADSDYNKYDSSDSAQKHVKKSSFKLDLSTWYGCCHFDCCCRITSAGYDSRCPDPGCDRCRCNYVHRFAVS